jgi:hypothetical protein
MKNCISQQFCMEMNLSKKNKSICTIRSSDGRGGGRHTTITTASKEKC